MLLLIEPEALQTLPRPRGLADRFGGVFAERPVRPSGQLGRRAGCGCLLSYSVRRGPVAVVNRCVLPRLSVPGGPRLNAAASRCDP
jgi:hypothetical protein